MRWCVLWWHTLQQWHTNTRQISDIICNWMQLIMSKTNTKHFVKTFLDSIKLPLKCKMARFENFLAVDWYQKSSMFITNLEEDIGKSDHSIVLWLRLSTCEIMHFHYPLIISNMNSTWNHQELCVTIFSTVGRQRVNSGHVDSLLENRFHTIYPSGHKCTLKTYWRPVLKTGLQDGYEDLITLTDPLFWRRIFKVLKTSILDVLQPRFNDHFKTSIQVVLNTTTEGSSKWCYNG